MENSTKRESRRAILEYLRVIRKYKWLVAAVFIIITSLTAIWNLTATQFYRATAQILIQRTESNVVNIERVEGAGYHLREFLVTQTKLLKSRNLAIRVVKDLQLAKKKGFGVLYEWEKNSIRQVLEYSVRDASKWVRSLVEKVPPTGKIISKKKNLLLAEERAIHNLMIRTRIRPIRLSNLVLVFFDDSDPEMAARVANSLSYHYLQMILEFRFSSTKEASIWLEKEIGKVQKLLVTSDMDLQSYREKYNLVSLVERENIIADKLNQLNSLVTQARASRIAAEVLYNQVKLVNSHPRNLTFPPYVIDSSVIVKLKGNYTQVLQMHSEMSKRYKSRHPKLLRLNSEIALIRKEMDREIIEIANNIRMRYQVAKEKEQFLERSVEEQKKESLRLSRAAVQYRSLLRNVETYKELYEKMLIRTKETNLIQGLNLNQSRIVDTAKIPNRPEYPNRKQNVLIGAVISLLLGVFLSIFLDYIDTRIRTPDEVESITNSPMLGVITELKGGTKGAINLLASEKYSDSILKEHFRELQTMAIFRCGENHRIIQVTSSIPMEGKTFISSNLSLGMSEVKKNVLLIDGDIHRQGIHNYFDIPNSPGLVNVLIGESSIEESLVHVPDSNLTIMPSGALANFSTRMFDTSMLSGILKSLRDNFEYIIIDTPPLLVISDPLIWARCVDGIIFVVDVRRVTTDMLSQAAALIHEFEIPIIGSIMNRITKNNSYYYYGYDKKYNYYYRSGRDNVEA